VLLLDEPLANLDSLLRRRLARDFARILREGGATVVWVTHDHDEALVVADDVAILGDGRIVASGAADEVMSLPADDWTAEFLGMEPPLEGVVSASADGLVEVRHGGVVVTVSGDAPVGSRVIFAVQPEDVILFEADAQLPITTARNQLQAAVVSREPRGSSNRITLDAGGLRLSASVSRASTADLGLEPERQVLAVFKATAVRWRSVDEGRGA
jgi:molybdopterin-binding protein